MRILLLIIFFSFYLNTSEHNFGIIAGGNFVDHQVNFIEIPEYPNCCVPYNSTSKLGIKMGFSYLFRLNDKLHFSTDLNFENYDIELSSREFIGNSDLNGQLEEIYTIHNLNALMVFMNFEPMVYYYHFSNYLGLGFGLSLGMFPKFEIQQYEDLSDDDIGKGFTFSDFDGPAGTRRNEVQGSVDNSLTQLGLKFSANTLIETESFVFQPELYYRYNTSAVIQDLDWNVHATGLNLKIYLNLNKETEIVKNDDATLSEPPVIKEELPRIDSVVVPKEIREQRKVKIPDTTIAIQLPNNGIKECCYIIFYSSKDPVKIQEIYSTIIDKSIYHDIRVDYWRDEDEVLYYLIVSKCFTNPESAFKEKDIIFERIKKNPDLQLNIKCDQ